MKNAEKKEWPQGCGYQGYEYGAAYPDSLCVGGMLFDADDCDGHGNLYEPAELIPCPMCHPRLAKRWHTNRNQNSGVPLRQAERGAAALVSDIRKNRKHGTEPWKTAK
jgi:hypothetical protein